MATASAQSAGIITAAQPKVQQHEGRELHVYKDSMGIPTIGVGFNLMRGDARQLCANCGAVYDALLSGLSVLTDAQCDWLYRECAFEVLEWMTVLFPAYFTYSMNRQIALLDMGFNLGETRFRKFRMMISAVLAGDWAKASEEALHSEWAVQVGERAIDDAMALSEG